MGPGDLGSGDVADQVILGQAHDVKADGTLEQVNGTSLVLTAASGQPVTVTTTASTFVSMSGARPRPAADPQDLRASP
jgi:hypothetical protein